MRIGLLGGSFDLAHFGHIFISLQAIVKFNLHQVWWLVAKQNPFKSKTLYSMQDRLKFAKHKASHLKKIKIFPNINNYTYDELNYLKHRYPSYNFVWIMGVDNLISFHKWHRYEYINQFIPIVIFNRGKLIYQAMKSRFVLRFIKNHVDINNFCLLPRTFNIVRIKIHSLSSSAIKKCK